MLQDVFTRFLNSTLYIQIQPAHVVVRDVQKGKELREEAVLVLKAQGDRKQVVGVGKRAADLAVGEGHTQVRPFTHPRTIISDFHSAEHLLRYLVKDIFQASWYRPSPRIVLHLPSEPEGGYTQVELRALQELAIATGAMKAALWIGRPLSDQEVLAWDFPAAAGKAVYR